MTLGPRIYHKKYFKRYKKIWERPWQIIFHIWESESLKIGMSVYLSFRSSEFRFLFEFLLFIQSSFLGISCSYMFNFGDFVFLKFGNVGTLNLLDFKMVISKFWNFEMLKFRRRAPENDGDPCNKIFNILDISFISIKKHEMDLL